IRLRSLTFPDNGVSVETEFVFARDGDNASCPSNGGKWSKHYPLQRVARQKECRIFALGVIKTRFLLKVFAFFTPESWMQTTKGFSRNLDLNVIILVERKTKFIIRVINLRQLKC
ncbi:hypothetical protein, partial [Enterobacter cloacae complex sp. 4DZ3-17B2]|uniref:hypothetical protein n=1 Tax=Enterobacter cloacae complex sp. 4DZ3-17B2 TaxID=2511990 RepID=UPI001CA55661